MTFQSMQIWALGGFRVRWYGVLLYHTGHGFQPPIGSSARAVSASVQCGRDTSEGVALMAKIPNLR
jgi:hypothetical protein